MLIPALLETTMPWGVVIVSALLGIIGVWLVVYFYRRFKKTENEAEPEEDWGSRLGLTDEPHSTTLTPAVETHDAVLASEAPSEPISAAPVSEISDAGPRETPAAPVEPRLQPTPPVIELNPVEAVKQSLAEEPYLNTERPAERETLPMTTPLSGEILRMSNQEAEPQPAAPQYATLEPYEPPRIEPIVPRKPAAEHRPVTAPNAPVSSAPATPTIPIPSLQDSPLPRMNAAERAPRPEVRLVQNPPEPPTQPDRSSEVPEPIIRHAEGPAASSARFSGQIDDTDIGTLANYGKSEDDGSGGRGGTIVLGAIILIIVGCVLAYEFVPSVHSALTKNNATETDAPKAQIFITRAETVNLNANGNSNSSKNSNSAAKDSNPNQQKMKGTVQNATNESLSGLVVGLSLIPRSKQGAPTNIDVPVTPDQIGAGESGDFDFDVDATKYEKYKVVNLKTKNGKDVPFAFPQSSANSTNQ